MSALPGLLPDRDTPAVVVLATDNARLRAQADTLDRALARVRDDLAIEQAAHAETQARLAWTEARLREHVEAARAGRGAA